MSQTKGSDFCFCLVCKNIFYLYAVASLAVVDVIKLFLKEIQISPNLRHLKMCVLNLPRCENIATFKQNSELSIAFKIVAVSY